EKPVTPGSYGDCSRVLQGTAIPTRTPEKTERSRSYANVLRTQPTDSPPWWPPAVVAGRRSPPGELASSQIRVIVRLSCVRLSCVRLACRTRRRTPTSIADHGITHSRVLGKRRDVLSRKPGANPPFAIADPTGGVVPPSGQFHEILFPWGHLDTAQRVERDARMWCGGLLDVVGMASPFGLLPAKRSHVVPLLIGLFADDLGCLRAVAAISRTCDLLEPM